MSDWKPIETAPNNIAILIAREDGEVEGIAAQDNDIEWAPFDASKPRLWGIARVTHWMPMPEPPK